MRDEVRGIVQLHAQFSTQHLAMCELISEYNVRQCLQKVGTKPYRMFYIRKMKAADYSRWLCYTNRMLNFI